MWPLSGETGAKKTWGSLSPLWHQSIAFSIWWVIHLLSTSSYHWWFLITWDALASEVYWLFFVFVLTHSCQAPFLHSSHGKICFLCVCFFVTSWLAQLPASWCTWKSSAMWSFVVFYKLPASTHCLFPLRGKGLIMAWDWQVQMLMGREF